MKKVLNQKQLENMIAECVGQVMTEARQPHQQKPVRKVMNEAQLGRYIQGIINEEMENEISIPGVKAMWNKLTGDASQKSSDIMNNVAQTGQRTMDSMNQAGRNLKASALKKGRQVRDFANRTGEKVGNTMNQVAQYGKDVMQTGKNASAAADAKKMADQIDALYQKYKPFFKDAKKDNQIRTAKSALLWLSQSFGNGLNADE